MIVAIELLLLLQTPPVVEVENEDDVPTHKLVAPVIAAGAAFTEIVLLTVPQDVVYCMVTTPAPIPVTTPVAGSTVALVGAVLVHVPPAALLVSVMVAPTQTDDGPAIGEGVAVTVTTFVAMQPDIE